MAAIFIGRRRRRQNAIPMRRPPVFCDLSNTLESLDEEEVYERYRFPPDTILFVEDEVSDILQSDTASNHFHTIRDHGGTPATC